MQDTDRWTRRSGTEIVRFDFSTAQQYGLCFDGRYLRLIANPYHRPDDQQGSQQGKETPSE